MSRRIRRSTPATVLISVEEPSARAAGPTTLQVHLELLRRAEQSMTKVITTTLSVTGADHLVLAQIREELAKWR